MTSNPILDEIYEARQRLLDEHGGDVHAYLSSARDRLLRTERPIADPNRDRRDEPRRRHETAGEPRPS